MGNDDASVKVAVRVRPFNQREKDRNAKMIIKMEGAKTTITNPADGATKAFTFDYSYYSHEGFETQDDGLMVPANPNTKGYADQTLVFNNLGKLVLDNAFEGYNTSLFAYGQTGSGKSYSMVGYGANKGIVPMACDHLFRRVVEGQSDTQRYEVTFSMLEIYNEAIRDLLTTSNPPGGLKVRENPKVGVYVDKLTHAAVASYEDIDKRTEEGTKNRTVAATNMNATSSRAHTVITIMFSQITKQDDSGAATEKKSKINLVDLAGSERADSTGATGDRLKEGSAINQSLSALGNVISALADISMGKKKVFVPYRNSVLTRILQDALGGNSKTIMIAALSPADINYEETLSTLRYADRAKKIKNKAVVNENPTEKLIRELKEENAKLMAMLKEAGGDPSALAALMAKGGGGEGGGEGGEGGGGGGGAPMTEEEKEKMRAEMEKEMEEKLAENARMMEEMQKSWQDKLAEAQSSGFDTEGTGPSTNKEKETVPHIANLNEDPALAGMITHFLRNEKHMVGRKDAEPDIPLSGLSILKDHALVIKEGEDEEAKFFIELAVPKAKVLVNGQQITERTEIFHRDRILFGSNHMYTLVLPHVAKKQAEELGEDDEPLPPIDWEFAQREIAKAQGFDTGDDSMKGKTAEEIEQQLINNDIVKLIPLVNEANAISEELGKAVEFQIKLMRVKGKTEVQVKMTDTHTNTTIMWNRDKFLNRSYLMREMYQRFYEEGITDIEQEKDPFWDQVGASQIGTAFVQLNALSYLLSVEDSAQILDYKGKSEGTLRVELLPCDEEGNHEDFNDFVEEPEELVGKTLYFLFRIPYARGLAEKYTKDVHCQFKWYLEEEVHKTKLISDTINPEFGFEKLFKIDVVTEALLRYLEGEEIGIEVWGEQVEKNVNVPRPGTSMSMRSGRAGSQSSAMVGRFTEEEVEDMQAELALAKTELKQLKEKEAEGAAATGAGGDDAASKEEAEKLRLELDNLKKENEELKSARAPAADEGDKKEGAGEDVSAQVKAKEEEIEKIRKELEEAKAETEKMKKAAVAGTAGGAVVGAAGGAAVATAVDSGDGENAAKGETPGGGEEKLRKELEEARKAKEEAEKLAKKQKDDLDQLAKLLKDALPTSDAVGDYAHKAKAILNVEGEVTPRPKSKACSIM
eukprot:TRINITY_DN720_c0_g1_i4.p1 TRINITY_DN720_c0_g1~~TRINITY_DN720_c0_g1_i4.p1  ORF type:complete len:1166 (+),score=530.39 TRINITY_DN720_c0_g1_i4:51-3500(+)